jgi:hypothetical protein
MRARAGRFEAWRPAETATARHGSARGRVPPARQLPNSAVIQLMEAQGRTEGGGIDVPPAALLHRASGLFGSDLSSVELRPEAHPHAGSAIAAAQGEQVYLTSRAPPLSSTAGLHVLGHELAHVVQQRQARASGEGVLRDRGLEQEADAAGQALAKGAPVPAGLLRERMEDAESVGAPVQPFGSEEHKSLGDEGTEGESYQLGDGTETGSYNQTFELTHGDIVALSGDFFSSRELKRDGSPDPDFVVRLAEIPSTNPGRDPGTRDEVVYALSKAMPDDPRFKPHCTSRFPSGGPWARLSFSAAVRERVDTRYVRMAASNEEHFVAPDGAGPASSPNAASGYRGLHEHALRLAFAAGAAGQSEDPALMQEAAGQHFLTDHFAAGHLRTPRVAIDSWWRAIYPNFWDALRRRMARDVAVWINANDAVGWVATEGMIADTVMTEIQAQTASLPPLTFGDIVSLLAHDHDNAEGLWVTNDVGTSWKLFGDEHMDVSDANNRTREMAELAVSLGVSDVHTAHQLGSDSQSQSLAGDVLQLVRQRSESPARAGGARYAPEQILPRLDPATMENGDQCWRKPDFASLWATTMTTVSAATFGQAIDDALGSGHLRGELEGNASRFPEQQPAAKVFTVHPRRGYVEGFLGGLLSSPYTVLFAICEDSR